MMKDDDHSMTCPLCSGRGFAPFRFGLVRCGGCGLVVKPAIFRPGAAEALNEEAFGEAYDTRPSFWVHAFKTVKNRRYLANLRRAGVTGGRLLEVGVGTGSFLVAARKAGFEVEGCDLSLPLCQSVQQATGIAVHNLPLERLPQGAYDVVAMHHVLEHVADPVGFLRAASERLKPSGVLHVAVPNVACWEAHLPSWKADSTTKCNTVELLHKYLMRSFPIEAFSGAVVQAVHDHGELLVGDGIE